MKTEVRGGEAITTISTVSKSKLRRVLKELGPKAKDWVLDDYKGMHQSSLWARLVGQVCVMGSARGMDKINRDQTIRTDFEKSTSIAVWKKHGFEVDYMAEVLWVAGATRFHNKAASMLKALISTPAVYRRGRLVLLDRLPPGATADEIRDLLMSRCKLLGRKSASDLMITVGLSDDVVALDQRVVGALHRHLGFNLTFSRVQANKAIYLSVEGALRQVCRGAKQPLAVLDRVLFRFSELSVLDFVLLERRA